MIPAQPAAQASAFDRRAFLQRFGLMFSFLLLILALSLLSERFLTSANLINILGCGLYCGRHAGLLYQTAQSPYPCHCNRRRIKILSLPD